MKKILYSYRLNVISILIFFIIALSAFYLTRGRLTLDFDKLTGTITTFLSVEEEARRTKISNDFSRFKNIVTEIEKLNVSDKWLENAFKESLFLLKEPYLEFFVVRNGSVFSNSSAVLPYNELKKQPWYGDILKADGKIVKTAPYCNNLNKQPTITEAQLLPNKKTIIGINIYLYRNQNFLETLKLPQGSEYFYFDAENMLLQSISADTARIPADTAYAENILAYIKTQKQNGKGSFIHTVNDKKYGIFYSISPKGWVSFITVPYKKIYPTPWIFISAVIILCIYSIFTFLSYRHEKRQNAESKFKEETIEFLGNMYFCIIRVNLITNTFRTIKTTAELKEKIQNITDYNELIKFLSAQIEKNASEDFLKFFSLNNLQGLSGKQNEEYSGDFRGKFSAGYRWINARLIINKSFNSQEAILCFRDIENEKQHQINEIRLLQSSLEQAQKSEQAKNEFFAKMSHDMRTPLNAIMGYITLAGKMAETKQEFQDYLNKIASSSDHLLELIDYILNVSRMENDRQQTNSEINLTECIDSCLEQFYTLATTQNKHFKAVMDIRNPYVLSSSFKIRQIFNNIISNSFKYSPEGAEISVNVRQLTDGKHCKYEITISDTGYGISKKFLDKIFVPYSRENRFASSSVQGTGLGMNIVKNIVSSLDGELLINSEEGKGTTVIIVLTLETTEKQKAQKNTENTAEPDLNGKTLLLVDDNHINMEILEKLLTIKGMVCEKAYNGLEALTVFENSPEQHFDCILMDLQMPVMGGLESAQKIRALNRKDALTVPIVALTANAFAEDIIATINAGMNCHLTKPINSGLLYQTIYDLTKK